MTTTITGTPRFDPSERTLPDDTLERLQAFSERWLGRIGNEQQLAQQFLVELCQALGTPSPGHDASLSSEAYCFERRVALPGIKDQGRIDLYKAQHFVLEAKCGRAHAKEPGSAPVRDTLAYNRYIQNAYNLQARVYAAALPEGVPPLLIVVDVGHKFWIWRGFDGRFDGYFSSHRFEIPLERLADETNAVTLWRCFEAPHELDPAHHQARVTRDAAARLAPIAASLETSMAGSADVAARVARFLMRCIFCMFAEDVGLLPTGHFSRLLQRCRPKPQFFAPEAGRLFEAMDRGGAYDFEAIRHFNGALFTNAEALELTAERSNSWPTPHRWTGPTSTRPSSAACWSRPSTPASDTAWAHTSRPGRTSSA